MKLINSNSTRPNSTRMPELDALRGLFLVWMTLTHMPTRVSDLLNQPFGFVSSAEGFVFMSGLLVSRVYLREAQKGEGGLLAKLWGRTLKIYGYHLLMLGFAFTVAAAFAARTHRPALYNLLNFYLAHPVVATIGSVLLIYCPPLLDILPMYVLFLFFTPVALLMSVRYGWKWILAGSGVLWLGAQFGLREFLHNLLVHGTHLPIPLQETGAFNLYAWQGIWISGLWIGAKSMEDDMPLARVPGYGVALCGAVCAFFFALRHGWAGPHLTEQLLGREVDKWQIGPLRLINIAAFVVVGYWLRRYVVRLIAREPLVTLGKASLQVFCAHVFFVFAALALLYGDISELHGLPAYGMLALTFTGLFLVASREVKLRREKRVAALEGGPQTPIVS